MHVIFPLGPPANSLRSNSAFGKKAVYSLRQDSPNSLKMEEMRKEVLEFSERTALQEVKNRILKCCESVKVKKNKLCLKVQEIISNSIKGGQLELSKAYQALVIFDPQDTLDFCSYYNYPIPETVKNTLKSRAEKALKVRVENSF